MGTFSMATHEAIARWKREAKHEDTEKYFYGVPEAEILKSSEKSFLISRKGTGKTAIGQHILKARRAGVMTASLNFKNFPFNELYGPLKDKAYRQPNQFLSGWRYVIYCNVARLLGENERAGYEARQAVRGLFPNEAKTSLARQISRWLSAKIKLQVMGNGFALEGVRELTDNPASFLERGDALRDFLMPHLGDSRYYVVFDELDDDYNAMGSSVERSDYLALLTSLLKAVQLVRDETGGRESAIYPIVLLRDDIFAQLRDSDRNKWLDSAVVLNWSLPQIKKLIAHRLSRAADLSPEWDFGRIWPELTGRHTFFTPRAKSWDKFEFITSYTLLRPRDFIFYLGEASRKILERATATGTPPVLSGDVLRDCTRDFAGHLKRELEDEIGGQLPHIEGVLNMIFGFGERHFTAKEFRSAYQRLRKSKGAEWKADPDTVLELLYRFSVIGFVRKKEIFRYQSPNIDFDFSKTLLLHKGLLGAMSPLK